MQLQQFFSETLYNFVNKKKNFLISARAFFLFRTMKPSRTKFKAQADDNEEARDEKFLIKNLHKNSYLLLNWKEGNFYDNDYVRIELCVKIV